jgi:hypothetical protein
MGIAIYGVTLSSPGPLTTQQTEALHVACRQVLAALTPERPPSDNEVLQYWRAAIESPFSAYWQTFDGDEAGQLHTFLEAHCRPLGMNITNHFSC